MNITTPRPAPAAEPKIAGSRLRASLAEAADYFRRGDSVARVAQLMNRAPSTISQYLADFIEAEKPASISVWVPEAIYKRVAPEVTKHGGNALRPVFEALQGAVPYEQIRLVVAHMRSKGMF